MGEGESGEWGNGGMGEVGKWESGEWGNGGSGKWGNFKNPITQHPNTQHAKTLKPQHKPQHPNT
ncbi:hypothetical protein EZJ55_24280 [Microcystis aeruginosa EAWAG127a]|uniref:Uncharacterized protein n=1 Tax=Microcystis aeruginosa EAWAG127a TaxID=2529855 RepID=A0A5J5M086_MICAE|nr:hypothetical protein [Microcystis aeruginosa]KAB0243190.1 hypothetical protein EZJ55_24280 [Microcystis aeruginosa EAWAG127a]